MKRVVIMAFNYDTVCFPTSPSYRVVSPDGTCATAVPGHRVNLVAGITRLLAEHGVVVDDVEQAEGEGCFAMILLARVVNPVVTLAQLREFLSARGRDLGVTLRVQREELFVAMHRI